MVLDAVALGLRIADARGRASMTQTDVARAAALDRSALAKIENGTRRVTALELARLASAIGERVEWFVTEAPPAIVSHRDRSGAAEPSTAIDRRIDGLARSVEFVQSHGALAELPAVPHLARPRSAAEAEERARYVRTLLEGAPSGPLLHLERVARELGVLVFSFGHGTDTADAASILLRHGAVVLVNGDRQVGRRRLAVAHEIGHCVFADEYTVDWNVTEAPSSDAWEGILDRFARALLLPRTELASTWNELRARSDVRSAAVRLASRYRVDMATLARRLREIGAADGDVTERVRRARTTRADIVEYDLLVHHEFAAPSLPLAYEQAVLRLFRDEVVSPPRATDLLFDLWDEEDLPELPLLPPGAVWQFVG